MAFLLAEFSEHTWTAHYSSNLGCSSHWDSITKRDPYEISQLFISHGPQSVQLLHVAILYLRNLIPRSANKSAPLLLWTNGGPGATSVGYGDFFQLIGPVCPISRPAVMGVIAAHQPYIAHSA